MIKKALLQRNDPLERAHYKDTNFYWFIYLVVFSKKVQNQKSKFFLAIGFIGLLAVLVGFSTTFIIPVGEGSFKAPLIIYVHGLLALSWVVLFIVQSFLIQKNNFRLHRILGYAGIAIAVGITISLIPVGLYQVEKDLAQGFGQAAVSSIVGTLTSGLIFISLVVAGTLKRRVPSVHKRLMLLATILLLWPAWFRFRHLFPSIPHPEIWFAVVLADSFIVVSMMWDKVRNGRVEKTLLYVGALIIVEHVMELYLYDGELWRVVANGVYGLLV